MVAIVVISRVNKTANNSSSLGIVVGCIGATLDLDVTN